VRKPFRRHRGARGAAAVEFALVMPILFLVMFGILQYGLYFNDALSTRQGVREAARLGVVQSFSGDGCTAGDDLAKLACRTTEQIDVITGTAYTKVSAPSWNKGDPLTVCALVKTETAGLAPMPNNGWILSKTQMSIEVINSTPSSQSAESAPALPSGPGIPTWSSVGC